MKSGARVSLLRIALPFLALIAAFPLAAGGQVAVKVNDDVNFRLGMFLQGWADWTQDPITEGYSQNLFLRRARFILAGNVAKTVSFFFETDNPRLGNSGTAGAKAINTGFLVQDAFLEWKLAGDLLALDGGLFYVPQSRGVLNSSSSNLSLDTPTFGLQQNAFVQASAGRDAGFALKGYLADDHLEYRAGVYSGQRQPPGQPPGAAGSRNSPRLAVRLQYDVFDPEKGYTYIGTNLGSRRVLALGAWGDSQGNFQAAGADVFADIPVGKDAVTAEADYLYYDGSKQFVQVSGGVTTPLLPKQDVLFADAGYYLAALRLQPFLRFERLHFREARFQTSDQQRYSGGVNWYISGQNLKLTAFYERVVPQVKPAGAAVKDTNHIAAQLQVLYF